MSTGIYKYPKQKVAEIAVNTIKQTLTKQIDKVIIVFTTFENHSIYEQILKEENQRSDE